MKRQVIKIDETLCNGCGLCIPNCPEGAMQLIDGKARLVSDLLCDGLGACLGHCPEGAITVIEREAEPYDERKVMEMIVPQGVNTLQAHLEHLREHNQTEYLQQALDYLRTRGLPVPQAADASHVHRTSPASRSTSLAAAAAACVPAGTRVSQLTHWPIQMHLLNPTAPHYRGSDLLLAADCVAFSIGDFHKDHLTGKTLAIACPKLDSGMEVYLEKLVALIEQAEIRSLTVMIMQVPCCGGLLRLAQMARQQAKRNLPIDYLVVGMQGEILKRERI